MATKPKKAASSGMIDLLKGVGQPLSMQVEFRSELFKALESTAYRVEFDYNEDGGCLLVWSFVTSTSLKHLLPYMMGKNRTLLFDTDAKPVVRFTEQDGVVYGGYGVEMSAFLSDAQITCDYSRHEMSRSAGSGRRSPDREADALYSLLNHIQVNSLREGNATSESSVEVDFKRWMMRQSAEIRDLLVSVNAGREAEAGTYLKLTFSIEDVAQESRDIPAPLI